MSTPAKITTNMSVLIQEVTVNGEEFLKIPSILAVEGIMNNLFYSAEVLGDLCNMWNGRPVIVFHRFDKNGDPLSVNSDPELAITSEIGKLFDVRMDGKKMKANALISKAKLEDHPDLQFKLNREDQIDVSTGLFIKHDGVPGEFKGQEYAASVTQIGPDHLAVLPGVKGACSWSDGAGLCRVNSKEEDTDKDGILKKQFTAFLKFMKGDTYPIEVNNEADASKLNEEDSEMDEAKIQEMLTNALAPITEALSSALSKEDISTAVKEQFEVCEAKRVEKAEADAKADLIAELVANEACKLSADGLKALPLADIKAYSATLEVNEEGDGEGEEGEEEGEEGEKKPVVNYAAKGTARKEDKKDDEGDKTPAAPSIFDKVQD